MQLSGVPQSPLQIHFGSAAGVAQAAGGQSFATIALSGQPFVPGGGRIAAWCTCTHNGETNVVYACEVDLGNSNPGANNWRVTYRNVGSAAGASTPTLNLFVLDTFDMVS
jgi:hypothetical protein